MRRKFVYRGSVGAVAAVIVVVTVVAAKAAVIVGRSGRGCNFLKPGSVKLVGSSSYFRRYTLDHTSTQLIYSASPAAPNASVTCEHNATPVTDQRSTLKRLSSPLLVDR